tara:strand:+ start:7316 stop:8230 length:915 start_codon:yes stop_codon:yes gene_type:complete
MPDALAKIEEPPVPPVFQPVALQEMRFGDRAVAFPLVANTKLVAESVGKTLIKLDLQQGAARFRVNKHPQQSFRVHAGPAVVVVVGTEFIVRHASLYVEVAVSEGSVEVIHLGETARVGTGETRRFSRDTGLERLAPPAQNKTAAVSRGTAGETDAQRTHADANPNGTPPSKSATKPEATSSPADLLQEADMARLGQDYQLAVRILNDVLAAQPQANTEVIAAFSLGRVLFDKLDRPTEAAHAFARARAADPDGNLAEDSLAREVEAYSRAGQRKAAHARATEYRRLYPNGRRLLMVMQLGGLK